jgi:HAMP domain-containing protein
LPPLPSETAPRLDDFKEGLINFEIWPGFSARVHGEAGANAPAEQVYAVSLFAGTEWKAASVPKWKVAFVQAPAAFLAPVRAQTQVLVLTALVIMAFVAGLAIWLGQYLAGPIIRLTAVTERVAAGDFEIQAKVESKDEIGLLATAFNQMTTQLGKLVGSLESQVTERTVDLALSMEVGQRASAIRNVDELIPTIVDFIQDQFDLYYVQILWVDDTGETLAQKAAASKSGAQALSYANIPINPQSVIGQAAATGEPVVVPDAHQHPLFVHDPALIYTRSSLTIPLLVENKVIAVLDMQSVDRYHFTSDNLTVYQAMATQVAVSIDSAEQWALAQKSQRRAEQACSNSPGKLDRKVSAHKGRLWAMPITCQRLCRYKLTRGCFASPHCVQNQPIGHLAVTPPKIDPSLRMSSC